MATPSCVITYLMSCLVLMTLLVPGLGQGSTSSQQTERELQASLVSRMNNVQQQLAEVTSSTQEMLSEIEKAIFDCIGTHSELCEALEVEAGLADKQGLQSYWSPGKRLGKRALGTGPHRASRLYDELQRKKLMAIDLTGLLNGAQDTLTKEKRGSCPLNLGFHCQTSHIADMAEYLEYLKGMHSPGKKRSAEHAQS